MSITILDIVVIVVILISAILAMVRGLTREILSLASWGIAAAAGAFLHPTLVPFVRQYVSSDAGSKIISGAAIFFVALIVASYITMKISDFIIDSRVGAIDRALGFIFGAVRGFLLLIISLWFFNFLVPKAPDWVSNAVSEPILQDSGEKLISLLPKDLEGWIHQHLQPKEVRDTEGEQPDSTETGGDSGAPPAAAPAPPKYDDSGVQQIINGNKESNGKAPSGQTQ